MEFMSPAPVSSRVLAVFSSGFFVVGGVASFVEGELTAPFYLAGSATMLTAAAFGPRSDMRHVTSVIGGNSWAWLWLVPAVMIVGGFWLGFSR